MKNEAITDRNSVAGKLREQAFNVEHYLGYWKHEPTTVNWSRVLGAVTGYAPEGDHVGQYFEWRRASGRQVALGRVTRLGARGAVYGRIFKKGTLSWGPEVQVARASSQFCDPE